MTFLSGEILNQIEQSAVRAMPFIDRQRSDEYERMKLLYCGKICRAAMVYFQGKKQVMDATNLDISVFESAV